MQHNNLPLEKRALSAILADIDAFHILSLRVMDFHDEAHRNIYKTVRQLVKEDVEPTFENLHAYNNSLSVADLVSLSNTYVPASEYGKLQKDLKHLTTLRRLQKAVEVVKTPEDLLKLSNGLNHAVNSMSMTSALSASKAIDAFRNTIKERKRLEDLGESLHLQTGFPTLDEEVGFRAGELICLAALPGIGKSTLALSVALSVAKSGGGVLFCSAEMGVDELVERSVSQLGPIPGKVVQECTDDSMITDGLNKLEELSDRLYFDCPSSLKSTDVCSATTKLKQELKGNLKLVIVDYLGALRDERDSSHSVNEVQRIEMMTSRFKSLARQEECVVLMLSQFSREASKEERPRLHQLRGSAAIEQDSDTVMILHRAERHSDEGSISIEKARRRGVGTTIDVAFEITTGTYREASKERVRETQSLEEAGFDIDYGDID